MATNNLHTSIEYLKGVGPSRAELLRKELDIHTLGDLANFFPNRYIDRTRFYKINQIRPNSAEVQIIGQITQLKTVQQQRGSRLVATYRDETGQMELVWFKGIKWIKGNLRLHTPYVAFGKVNWFNGMYSMPHPELELQTEYDKSLQSAMQPVYPSTDKLSKKGISNRVIIKMLENLFSEITAFRETLSPEILTHYKLVPKTTALFNVHFPKSLNALSQAQYRLKFEELFFVQLQLLRKNYLQKTKIKGYVFNEIGAFFNDFYTNHLPFELTDAQKRVVKEIRKDMVTGAQMNRLLQGDVGSGKTIVAFLSTLIALDNGFQAAIIAPTEILAIQHYQAITVFSSLIDINIALLTGSTKKKERTKLHEQLEDGTLHILIGTHALFEDKVKFKNLGLAVIDEQHKFGVAQRAKMWMKNKLPPHILVMTATPIPRTLAMSLYGDLDISVIDELPPGRKPIITAHRYDKNRLSVFKFIKEQIANGSQVYMVYPLIKESQKLDLKDLMDGYESVERYFPKPKYQISIVHGQLKPADKDYEMNRFVKGETQIMVATTVIEVGVNVPNANIMIIESAARFGLSQLHQLRGRVGRGSDQSYCILMTDYKLSRDAKTRLETMVRTNDGFEIAEVDLKLRGPGDLMGTQQSGILNLKIADIVRDNHLLGVVRNVASKLLQKDPNLEQPNHKNIRHAYGQIVKNKGIWVNIS